MVSKLSAGDEVVTSGGILGRMVEVGDAFLTVEVADGVRVKVQKGQVTSLMPKGTLKSVLRMLEYPRWKYLLVLVVLGLALILALPNVFGEAPALQVARKDHDPMLAASLGTVEQYPEGRAPGIHQRLLRWRARHGALCQRGGSVQGARRGEHEVCRPVHHRAVIRLACAGGAARAGTAAHEAGPGPAGRSVPALPGGHPERHFPVAGQLCAGPAPGPLAGQPALHRSRHRVLDPGCRGQPARDAARRCTSGCDADALPKRRCRICPSAS